MLARGDADPPCARSRTPPARPCPSTARASRSAARAARPSIPARGDATRRPPCSSPTSACTRRRTHAGPAPGGEVQAVLLRHPPAPRPRARRARRRRRRRWRSAVGRRLGIVDRRAGRAAPRRGAPRRRQDGDPRRDPREARAARRGGVGVHAPAHGPRRAHPLGRRLARAARRRSSAPPTSAGTATAIPTASRASRSRWPPAIVFACDAYDAMTSDRPYAPIASSARGRRRAPRRRRHPVRPGGGRGSAPRSPSALSSARVGSAPADQRLGLRAQTGLSGSSTSRV